VLELDADARNRVEGYVPEASRGRVSGTASGVDSAYSSLLTIGWSNADNEYWVRTDESGAFTSPYIKPGTYDMTRETLSYPDALTRG